jgi:propanol-preferring alcohol dehydrogenase
MNAIILEKPAPVEESPLAFRELPDPQPGDGEVQVRVHACAACRTDLHIVEGELPPQSSPIIPGHQIIGTVSMCGPNCHRLKVGMRVGAAWLRYTCGVCEFCKNGQENLCERARFTGYHENGGYAEYTLVPEEYAYEIPSLFSDAEAAPLLCAGIIGYRALKKCRVKPKGTLAMVGFGSSAHIVLQIAKHRGVEVYVVTRGQAHRSMAKKMGAAWVGSNADEIPVKMDGAILFAPSGDLVPPALATLKKGGTLAIADIYMTPIPSLNYEKHLFYEKEICSVTANTREDGRELLAEAAKIPIRTTTTTYPLHEANRALQDMKHGRMNGTGVLVVA